MCLQGMVCVANEPRCQCIVHDPSKGTNKFEATLPGSTPVAELINQVANKMKYEPSSFRLSLMSKDDSSKILTEETVGTLESVGLSTELRNSFLLEGVDGKEGRLVPKSGAGDEVPPPPPPPQHESYPRLRPSTTSPDALPSHSNRHETGYVGLVNQAMTCYLNSLLQALYMTPEFRNALYKWQYDPTLHTSGPAKSIPFQLQKLFLNLQTSSKSAIETTELTKSFGWESGECWQQHDIQELCRVMFDALEQEFKETQQADLINQLYQGKMIDYVKCLECGTEKSREDTFLDIPLPVRPFGSNVAYGSVQEALRGFVQPETLDGNNQYYCEKCDRKCDAHKGLKFTKFPYLLTLHLKRFDFDYSTLHRIKLNDKLVFPDILDLNSFVNGDSSTKTEGDGGDTPPSPRNDDSSIADSVLDEEASNTADTQNNDVDQDEDEGIDMNSGEGGARGGPRRGGDEAGAPLPTPTASSGPYLYELYSIMIHSGSASGGHYYAYIKDFTRNEWFCFNDQSVSSITLDDIKKTYGGSGGSTRGYYSGAFSSSTNAYMLMYRQIDRELNRAAIVEEEFPQHIKKLLEEVKEAEERENAIRARQLEMLRIRVVLEQPQSKSTKLYCSPDMTLKQVKDLAYRQLDLDGVVPEDQCRLVMFNPNRQSKDESLDHRDQDLFSEVFKNKLSTHNLLMEIREKGAKFLPYSIGDINLTVYMYDTEECCISSGPHEMRVSPCQTVGDFKELLRDYLSLLNSNLHIVLINSFNLSYLRDDSLPLNKHIGVLDKNTNRFRIFISYKRDVDEVPEEVPFCSSRLYQLIDQVKKVKTVHIILPDTRKETLDALLIPPLEEKPADSTPTGESQPLANGVPEEELCFGGGGGGDQSASEDSSLTDSDRTIIGENVNECLASDPDLHLQMSDSQISSKTNEGGGGGGDGSWEEEGSSRPPGADDPPRHQPLEEEAPPSPSEESYYFRATPYETEGSIKMLKVIADSRATPALIKKRLEKWLGVDRKWMNLRTAEGKDVTDPIKSLRHGSTLSVKLQRDPAPGEHQISVMFLEPNADPPTRHLFHWIVNHGESIASIRKALLKVAAERKSIIIPYERCRLRRLNIYNPGPVLLDSEVWDGRFRAINPAVYIQELSGPEVVTAPKQCIVFVRRWRPATQTLEPFSEVVIESNPDFSLAKKLSEMSEIPLDNLKYAFTKNSFPGESVSEIGILSWDTDADTFSPDDWARENGTAIFYRDDREEIKNPTGRDETTSSSTTTTSSSRYEGSSTSSNTSSSTFSYTSSLSQRKEKALKIYVDPSPKRSPATGGGGGGGGSQAVTTERATIDVD